MSRQLNPGLFGELGAVKNSSLNDETFISTPFGFNDESPLIIEMIEQLKKELADTKFISQESLKTNQLKLEKIMQKQLLFEERLNMLQKELHEKFNDLSTKVRDKSLNETKIESLIERHNQIVQSFELRLSQAQRLIDNQSLQLAKQQELIDDSRRQIEKLKKL